MCGIRAYTDTTQIVDCATKKMVMSIIFITDYSKKN
jgi:hypothetical protein